MANNNSNHTRPNMTNHCAFCGRSEKQVLFLIPSPTGLYICDACVEACSDLIYEHTHLHAGNLLSFDTLPKPIEIKETLDEYVIGQEQAKKVLSVAVYNHYKRILYKDTKRKIRKKKNVDTDVEIQKSNVLLLGPTGVGKTYLAQTLAKTFQVPFAIADATTLTEAGYVGEDVENILLRLIQAADYDIELAERGIIYIDEIDKISRRGENRSITRDVSGEGVQQALLKILEGTISNVPPQGGRKHPNQDFIQINTENILFICGGAFDGLDQIIEQRKGNQTIGFNSGIKQREEKIQSGVYKDVTSHDIIKYGLIPELVGRLPVMVTLDYLDKNALIKILKEPKNSLVKQYTEMFNMDKITLTFDDAALAAMASLAIERDIGARGLRAIMEEVMLSLMYEMPSREDVKQIIITEEFVRKNGAPRLILTESQRPALPEQLELLEKAE